MLVYDFGIAYKREDCRVFIIIVRFELTRKIVVYVIIIRFLHVYYIADLCSNVFELIQVNLIKSWLCNQKVCACIHFIQFYASKIIRS